MEQTVGAAPSSAVAYVISAYKSEPFIVRGTKIFKNFHKLSYFGCLLWILETVLSVVQA